MSQIFDALRRSEGLKLRVWTCRVSIVRSSESCSWLSEIQVQNGEVEIQAEEQN